jgi:thiol-disulfide isomerase/thioredoxin
VQPAQTAQPDPSGQLRVVYFFADRCPNCPIMEPLLMDALGRYDRQSVAYIPIDLDKALHREDPERVRASLERAAAVADAWRVGLVFDAYFQYTGLAVLTARDSGEVISCLARSLTSDEMQLMIEDARKRVRAYPPFGRTPEGGPDCPPPRA